MQDQHQFVGRQFTDDQPPVGWKVILLPEIVRQMTLGANYPKNTAIRKLIPSPESYSLDEVSLEADIDFAFGSIFALNHETALVGRVDYRGIDFRQANDAESILG